jgi:polyisoprenoid-binding protein YceI
MLQRHLPFKITSDDATLTHFHGITKEIVIFITKIGAGNDPWGGYRRGFEGKTRIALKDYGITKDLGPASTELELLLNIEGIKQ